MKWAGIGLSYEFNTKALITFAVASTSQNIRYHSNDYKFHNIKTVFVQCAVE